MQENGDLVARGTNQAHARRLLHVVAGKRGATGAGHISLGATGRDRVHASRDFCGGRRDRTGSILCANRGAVAEAVSNRAAVGGADGADDEQSGRDHEIVSDRPRAYLLSRSETCRSLQRDLGKEVLLINTAEMPRVSPLPFYGAFVANYEQQYSPAQRFKYEGETFNSGSSRADLSGTVKSRNA